MDMILKTTDLCKRFKEQQAVDRVSLNIERNSIYGLLGANGAGKFTILKMVIGIYRPTSGEIEFDNHPWSRSDLHRIGALVETPPLYENLSAYENLKARTLALGLPEKRINDVLEIVMLQLIKRVLEKDSHLVTVHSIFGGGVKLEQWKNNRNICAFLVLCIYQSGFI